MQYHQVRCAKRANLGNTIRGVEKVDRAIKYTHTQRNVAWCGWNFSLYQLYIASVLHDYRITHKIEIQLKSSGELSGDSR